MLETGIVSAGQVAVINPSSGSSTAISIPVMSSSAVPSGTGMTATGISPDINKDRGDVMSVSKNMRFEKVKQAIGVLEISNLSRSQVSQLISEVQYAISKNRSNAAVVTFLNNELTRLEKLMSSF